MNKNQAAEHFARLVAQFPSLGGDGNDPFAAARANDWIDFLCRYDEPVVHEAAELLIRTWTRDRYPRIGDFQEIARGLAARSSTKSLPGPEATYACAGGCEDPGLVAYTSGIYDVGNEGRVSYQEATPDRPVMGRCPACNNGKPPRRAPAGVTANMPNPTRVPVDTGLRGVAAARAALKGGR